VQVSDFGHAADGTAYLVMEYLRGQSLGRRIRDLVERGERLSVETALHVCVQVADVFSMAHGQGIVHRDLKPDQALTDFSDGDRSCQRNLRRDWRGELRGLRDPSRPSM